MSMSKRITIALLLCLLGISAAHGATVVYVDADAPGPIHNGTSWATAYTGIGQAISATGTGSDYWIAAGTYRESVTMTQYSKLYGGFLGYETSLSQRLGGAFPTIIDPGGAGRGIDVPTQVSVTIEGITIRNGKADDGGGIRCQITTTATIINCRFENCRATNRGGGIYMGKYSYGDIINCEMIHNKAVSGGGIYVEYHSYPVVRNCLIVRNHATGSGGGVFGPYHAGPDFENCTIAYNSAEVSGGGGYDYYGSPMILNYCIIAFNSAPVGGGLFGGSTSSALTYSHCDLYGNVGGDLGGMIKPAAPAWGNFSADPRFLMPDRDEFRLRFDSPCAGVGCYPLDSPYNLNRIGIAKLLPDGTAARINRLVVSCSDGVTTYLQSPDRSAAIAVQGLNGYNVGDLLASVTGTVSTNPGGAKILSASASTLHAAGRHIPEPLGSTLTRVNRMIGLRTKTWGRVTEILPGGFRLSDGETGVPVRWAGAVQLDSIVSVTGVYTLDSDFLASECGGLTPL